MSPENKRTSDGAGIQHTSKPLFFECKVMSLVRALTDNYGGVSDKVPP